MMTTVMIKGTHGLDEAAGLAGGAGLASAAVASERPLRVSAVLSAIKRKVYRFKFTTSCNNSSLVVMILELASKARWAVIKLAIWAARSTLDNSSESGTMVPRLPEPGAPGAESGPAAAM